MSAMTVAILAHVSAAVLGIGGTWTAILFLQAGRRLEEKLEALTLYVEQLPGPAAAETEEP